MYDRELEVPARRLIPPDRVSDVPDDVGVLDDPYGVVPVCESPSIEADAVPR